LSNRSCLSIFGMIPPQQIPLKKGSCQKCTKKRAEPTTVKLYTGLEMSWVLLSYRHQLPGPSLHGIGRAESLKKWHHDSWSNSQQNEMAIWLNFCQNIPLRYPKIMGFPWISHGFPRDFLEFPWVFPDSSGPRHPGTWAPRSRSCYRCPWSCWHRIGPWAMLLGWVWLGGNLGWCGQNHAISTVLFYGVIMP